MRFDIAAASLCLNFITELRHQWVSVSTTFHLYSSNHTFITSGIPSYRTRVLYVPQRPSLLPGTPRDFLHSVTSFRVRRRVKDQNGSVRSSPEYPMQVASEWGIDETLWDRDWTNLSGGESQRIALAVAVGLNSAEILLLDGQSVNVHLYLSFNSRCSWCSNGWLYLEPTSALDMGSSLEVCLKACVIP